MEGREEKERTRELRLGNLKERGQARDENKYFSRVME